MEKQREEESDLEIKTKVLMEDREGGDAIGSPRSIIEQGVGRRAFAEVGSVGG